MLRNANPRAVFTDTLWRLTEHARAVAEREIDDDAVDPARPWEWVAAAASSLGVVPAHGEGRRLAVASPRRCTRWAADTSTASGATTRRCWSRWPQWAARPAPGFFATGQGLLPPLEEPEWSALKKALEGFDIVDVRDAASREALDGLAPARGWPRHRVRRRRLVGPATAQVGRPRHRRAFRRRRGADPLPSGGVVLCLQSDLIEDFTFDGTTGVPALADYADATLRHWGSHRSG